MDIQAKIEAILKHRKQQLPEIAKQIARWDAVKQHLVHLNITLHDILKAPDLSDELRQTLQNVHPLEIQPDISSIVMALEELTERFSRDSINIGVSGQARVGKSTLLQTISGLGEAQIPTGDNLPVTAVKSQIFYTDQESYADIEFHTFQSFRENVLQPYHNELGLNTPNSLDEFKRFVYPKNESDLIENKRNTANITVLEKLKQMQSALWSYDGLLNKAPQKISLDALREYVAYPTHQQEKDVASCERKYLAVKDVKIYCNFPYAPVKQLGLIDLPGLGELSASVEEHHLQGLKKGVDFVVLVKRPGGTEGFWTAKDGSAANLLDKARSYQDRKDFVNILINKRSDVTIDQIDALRDHIHREVNQNETNKVFSVLEADAKNTDSVKTDLLSPILQHLAERLTFMDKQMIEGTLEAYQSIEIKIQQLIEGLDKTLKQPVYSSSKREQLEDLANQLKRDLSLALQQVVSAFHSQGEDDEEYSAEIDKCADDIYEWIEQGFGQGSVEQWQSKAKDRIAIDRGASGFALDQSNQIRVEISKRFSHLDIYFHEKLLKGFFERIADIFIQHTGVLLSGEYEHKKAVIDKFKQYLLEAQENGQLMSCTSLAAALDNILKLNLDYRSQLHPRVRECLNGLSTEVQGADNNTQIQGVTNNPDQLYKNLATLAEGATYATRKALQADVQFPKKVLFASAEQLEDEFVRGQDSDKEFKRLAYAYSQDLWAEHFKDMDLANNRINKIRANLNDLRQALAK